MFYIVEKRYTVGAYGVLGVFTNKDTAVKVYTLEVMHYEEEWKGCAVTKNMTAAQKRKNPDVIAYTKLGGSTHQNVIIRIREMEEKF